MNLFIREIRANRKSLIIWCGGILLLVAGGMAKYAGYSTAGQSVNDLIKQMPRAMQSIVGIGAVDLSTAMGFFSVLYLYLLIMTGVHAGLLGANIVAKEEEFKTAEFLFAKPVSRSRVMTAKILAALINIIILNAVAWVSSQIIVGYYSRGEDITQGLRILMTGMLFFQLLFLTAGTALAALKKRSKDAASICAGILLGTFIISLMIDINDNLSALKYLTPFKYFEASSLLTQGGLPDQYIILSISIIVILLGVSYIFYLNRDINI